MYNLYIFHVSRKTFNIFLLKISIVICSYKKFIYLYIYILHKMVLALKFLLYMNLIQQNINT